MIDSFRFLDSIEPLSFALDVMDSLNGNRTYAPISLYYMNLAWHIVSSHLLSRSLTSQDEVPRSLLESPPLLC